MEGQILPNVLGKLVVGEQEYEARMVLAQEQALGPLARGVADRDGTPLDAEGNRVVAEAAAPEIIEETDEAELNDAVPADPLVSDDAVKAAEQALAGASAADVTEPAEQKKKQRRGLAD